MTTPFTFRQLELLWISAGGPRGWAPLMAGIAFAESGGTATAVQPTQPPETTGWGLWQITPGTRSMLVPSLNAAVAVQKFNANPTPLNPWMLDRTWTAWAVAGKPPTPSVQDVKGYLARWGWTTTTPGLKEDEMIATTSWVNGTTSHVVVTTTTPTGKKVVVLEHLYQNSGLGTTRWHYDTGFPPPSV